MRACDFAFTAAALAGLIGMGFGIRMGMSQDFTLAPAHAHLNLLGWVTMALYGLYHRTAARRRGRLVWAQVGCGAAGAVLMAGGLAAYLATGDGALTGLIVAGSLLSVASMALFLAIVLSDARLARPERAARCAPADAEPAR